MGAPVIGVLSEFQDLLNSMSHLDFEKFVLDILHNTGRFSVINVNSLVGYRQVDIVAEETDSLSQVSTTWLFEIKKMRMVNSDAIDQLSDLRYVGSKFPHVKLVIVTSGHLTAVAKSKAEHIGVETWDAVILARLTTDAIAERFFRKPLHLDDNNAIQLSMAESLVGSLKSINPGREGWAGFQQLSSQVLEYLFCPPLEAPRYEHADGDSRNRRDMILENASTDGFWNQIRNIYGAHDIVADAKNYDAPLKKQPVLDLAHYLKPYGCGLFGILLCRRGAGLAARHALREQWIGGKKMMIVLSDPEIEEMILIKSKGGKPEELIRKLIADFRMSL